MRRIAIALEVNDNSQIVRASILLPDEERIVSEVLERSGAQFDVREVKNPLFHYLLEKDKTHIDLALRTKDEVLNWIEGEKFETMAKEFLESNCDTLQLSFEKNARMEIRRQIV